MSDHFSDLPPGAADTAERLRRAFAEQAAQTEPAPDAYARLAERVAEASAGRGGRGGLVGERSSWFSPSGWWPSSRLAFAGVVTVLVLFGGGYVLTRQPGGEGVPDGGPADSGVPLPVPDGEPAPDEGEDDGGGVTEAGDEEPSEAGDEDPPDSGTGDAEVLVPRPDAGDLEPVRDSPTDAAQAFLSLLGVETLDVLVLDNVATVRSPPGSEGESGRIITELDVVPVDRDGVPGWVVEQADANSHIMIDQVVWADGSDPAAGILVEGRTSIGEPGVIVEVRSAVDGSLLASTTAAGATTEQPVRYSATVSPVGTDNWAWIVVRAAPGAEGSVPAAPSVAAVGGGVTTGPVAAVPVRLDEVPDESTYVVVNIRDDDADGGLNLRSAPGADADRIETLPPATMVHRLPEPPVGIPGTGSRDGGVVSVDVWWSVQRPDGPSGWVSAAYLAASGPISDPELDAVARAVLDAAANPEAAAVSFPVWWRGDFTVVTGAGEVTTLDSRQLVSPPGWRDPVVDDRSLIDLLAWPPEGASDLQVTRSLFRFATSTASDFAVRDFASLPHATASYTGTDGQPHHVHIFVEAGPPGTGAAAVGLIIETGQLQAGG